MMDTHEDEGVINRSTETCSTTTTGSYTFGKRCVAPSLEEYLSPGGHIRYLPRSEWLAHGIDRDVWKRSESSKSIVQPPTSVADISIGVDHSTPINLHHHDSEDWAWFNGQLSSDQSILWGLQVPRLTSLQSQNPPLLFSRFDTPPPDENTAISFANYMFLGDTNSNTVGQSLRSGENMDVNRRADSSSHATISSSELFLERRGSFLDEIVVFGKDCNSALHMAIREGAEEAALNLIEMGTDPNVPNIKGVTPIILSSQRGNLKVTQTLFAHGANLSVSSYNGTTALIQASHFGHVDIVRFLLKHGALQNQANLKSTTALMRGSQEGHMVSVQI